MPEENNAMEIMKDVAKDIAKDAYQDIRKPVVQPASETLGLVPRAVKAALLPLEKWILQREFNLSATKKLLEEKLENTPHELIQPPEPHIAVPAIQYLEYCMDNEELREMYANLLASSMNAVVKNGVHPAFVEIIKQLSPDEAKILKYFKIHQLVPCITLRETKENGAGVDVIRNFSDVGERMECENPLDICQYFDNLMRLGLLESPGELSSLTNKARYEPLKNHRQIKNTVAKIEARTDEYNHARFEESFIRLTAFGEKFCEICLSTTNFVVTTRSV